MGRVNKKTEGVFVKIFGDQDSLPAFEIFLNNNNPENPSAYLKRYTKMYKDYIAAEKLRLEHMSVVEELIMQLRSKEQISDIKVSIVRDYIYARCAFYRNDTTSKDVRVIVDNKDTWNLSLKKLNENEEFMAKAKEKLVRQMNAIIEINVQRLAVIQEKIDKQSKKAKPVIQEKPKKVEQEEPAMAE